MKILVRNKETGQLLAGNGEWVDEPDAALNFAGETWKVRVFRGNQSENVEATLELEEATDANSGGKNPKSNGR